MIFSDSNDINRCEGIVKKELLKNSVDVNNETLNKITLEIMNISYSKGGGYTDEVIQSFAETYIEEGFYLKFIE